MRRRCDSLSLPTRGRLLYTGEMPDPSSPTINSPYKMTSRNLNELRATKSTKAGSITVADSLSYVTFGRTEWQVSEVCAGTMTWGSFNDKEEMAWEQLDKAVELGVNFIDTAELYPVAFNYGKPPRHGSATG